MNRTTICSALLLASGIYAQPTITLAPTVLEKSHSFATVYWETDVNSSTRIEYGLTTSYGQVSDSGKLSTVHGYMMSGLAPGTTYHFRACSSTAVDQCQSSTCRCSSDMTVTTDPEPTQHPEPPEPPTEFDVSMPPSAANEQEWNLTANGSGRVLTLNAQCATAAGATLQQVLSALAAFAPTPASDTLEIRIPAGAVCTGHFNFPARPAHEGWVVVRQAGPYSTIPPEGSRMRPEYVPNLPTIQSNVHWGRNIHLAFFPSYCRVGEMFRDFGGSGFPVYTCQPGGDIAQPPKTVISYSGGVFYIPNHGFRSGEVVATTNTGLTSDGSAREITVLDNNRFRLNNWTPAGTWNGTGIATRRASWWRVSYQQFTSGSSLPSSCNEGAWHWKTDIVPETDAGYLCTSPNTWTSYLFNSLNSAADSVAIGIPAGASRYRFVGLHITRVPGLQSAAAYGLVPSVNTVTALVTIDRDASDVIFDRVYLNGVGYPQRTPFGIYLDGKRVALINSRVEHIDRWLTGTTSGNWEAYAVNIGPGPGPGRIENNYLECTGITVFWTDGHMVATVPADYVVRRNTLTSALHTMKGHQKSDGKYYYRRHHWEAKRGKRISVTGNQFSHSWASTNKGEFLIITPTSSAPSAAHQTLLTITGAMDSALTVNVSLNPDWRASASRVWVKITGSESHDGVYKVAGAAGNTITLANGPSGTSTRGTLAVISSAVEVSDIDIRYNTFAHGTSLMSSIGMHNYAAGVYPTYVSKRIRFDNNLIYDLNFRSFLNGGWAAQSSPEQNGRGSWLIAAWYGVEDLTITNNLLDGMQSENTTNFLYADSGVEKRGPNEGLVFRNNVAIGSSNFNAANLANSTYGTTMLDRMYQRYPEPTWDYSGNLLCCGLTTASVPGNQQVSSADKFKLFSRANRNYRFRHDSSYFRGRKGPDLEALEAEQGKVSNIRLLDVGRDAVTVAYYAPDAAACTIEYGRESGWGTGSRRSDGGGNRNRTVRLEGLSSGSNYCVRVLCAVQQEEQRIRTLD